MGRLFEKTDDFRFRFQLSVLTKVGVSSDSSFIDQIKAGQSRLQYARQGSNPFSKTMRKVSPCFLTELSKWLYHFLS